MRLGKKFLPKHQTRQIQQIKRTQNVVYGYNTRITTSPNTGYTTKLIAKFFKVIQQHAAKDHISPQN